MRIPEAIVEECVAIRRKLHRHPELSHEERRTRDLVSAELAGTGFEVRSVGPTGVVALWPGRDRSRCVALRADMDALPLRETSGKPWASVEDGVMHACGHDGHTGILLAVAKCLARAGEPYPADIKLIFQPAEESGHGARKLILAGALREPETAAIFALHGWPGLAAGRVSARPGPVMASVDNFSITVEGKGGHGAQPHRALDPVLAACQLVNLAQSLVARTVDPLEAAVLSFCAIQGGQAFNVIPETCTVKGTLRALDNRLRERLKASLEALGSHTCQALGLDARLEWVEACPATVNDPVMAGLVRRAVETELGPEAWSDEPPDMAGEDFSYFLEQVPGAYFWLGLGDAAGSLHNPRFDFNDNALETGVRVFLAILGEYFRDSN